MFFVLSCVCYIYVRVCLYVLCGHLLGKGWPLGSRLWCLTVSLSLSHWYPGPGVVLDLSIPDLCTLTYFYLGFGGRRSKLLQYNEILQSIILRIFSFQLLKVLDSTCSRVHQRLLNSCTFLTTWFDVYWHRKPLFRSLTYNRPYSWISYDF